MIRNLNFTVCWISAILFLTTTSFKPRVIDRNLGKLEVKPLVIKTIDVEVYKKEREERILEVAFTIIAKYEGFRATPYKCPAGKTTIGYGHTNLDIQCITKEESKKLVYKRMRLILSRLEKSMKVYHTENQLSSLISFSYNVSEGRYERSTLYKLLNTPERSEEDVRDEFMKWSNIYYTKDGKVLKKSLKGLVKRRLDEFNLWNLERSNN